ncbi:hypothetical protein [Streptomyces massasporeus]|uniref:hypothetical protein n=1 Tax=Streptomyces massasporeus TaxID=67324 RepID=UPI00332CBEAD
MLEPYSVGLLTLSPTTGEEVWLLGGVFSESRYGSEEAALEAARAYAETLRRYHNSVRITDTREEVIA